MLLGAADEDAACRVLRERHGFTEVQARAVLNLQFRYATATEREALEQQRRHVAAYVGRSA